MVKVDGFTFWREKLNSARFVLAPMVDQSEVSVQFLIKVLDLKRPELYKFLF